MQFETSGLEEQLRAYRSQRFLAFPLAGAIAWAIVGFAGIWLSTWWAAMVLFIATGSIVYLGLGLMRLTGEHVPRGERRKNPFDALFFLAVAGALLVYAIAIPFFMIEPTSLPLTVGILTGLMWMPTTWLMGHWAGVFHAVTRTVGIVLVYLATIIMLEGRWRRVRQAA